jgi:hypothetical protein
MDCIRPSLNFSLKRKRLPQMHANKKRNVVVFNAMTEETIRDGSQKPEDFDTEAQRRRETRYKLCASVPLRQGFLEGDPA